MQFVNPEQVAPLVSCHPCLHPAIVKQAELTGRSVWVCADVKLFWHPQGDFLAVQVDRFTKTRKSTYTSFELFSVKERDIPMEVSVLAHAAGRQNPACWSSLC